MKRLASVLVVAASALALAVAGCGGGAKTRRLSAQLKTKGAGTASDGTVIQPRAASVIKSQLRSRALVRAKKSPAWAKSLATKFTRMGVAPGRTSQLRQAAKTSGRHPLDVIFDTDIAVFAYDDSSGSWLDSQYLDPDTGYYDIGVPIDSPVSLWVGTYDGIDASIVAPMTYGYDYELPPADVDLSWDYDPYFWAAPTEFPTDGYLAAGAAQDGYYQLDYVSDDGSGGTAWFYLLPDPDSVDMGAYVLFWDDGSCAPTRVYAAFDSSGSYFSVNGMDAPLSFSGLTPTMDYLEGEGRMTVVGDDGLTYYATIAMSYLDAPPAQACDAGALVVPADPASCLTGCSLDLNWGICVTDTSLDVNGVGWESCELIDIAAPLSACPAGCTEDAITSVCYDDVTADICLWS